MKITHIRIRKLVSRPTGYGHDAIELEAQINPDTEDYETEIDALRVEVERQLQKASGHRDLSTKITDLYEEIHGLELRRDSLKGQVDENRKAIREHVQLLKLANEAGIDAHALDDNLMPF